MWLPLTLTPGYMSWFGHWLFSYNSMSPGVLYPTECNALIGKHLQYSAQKLLFFAKLWSKRLNKVVFYLLIHHSTHIAFYKLCLTAHLSINVVVPVVSKPFHFHLPWLPPLIHFTTYTTYPSRNPVHPACHAETQKRTSDFTMLNLSDVFHEISLIKLDYKSSSIIKKKNQEEEKKKKSYIWLSSRCSPEKKPHWLIKYLDILGSVTSIAGEKCRNMAGGRCVALKANARNYSWWIKAESSCC